MAQQSEVPQLTIFSDIKTKYQQVLDWAQENPDEDHVYHFECSKDLAKNLKNIDFLLSLKSINACVAGSSALNHVEFLLHQNSEEWQSNDVDLFFLDQPKNGRVSFGNFDLVQCQEKTVEELLLNFDLPVCRVGYSLSYDIWISAQCINAIYTKSQNIPAYMKSYTTFEQTQGKETTAGGVNKTHWLYTRFSDRVMKYQTRGYKPIWIDTKKVLPWINKRFTYAEWAL